MADVLRMLATLTRLNIFSVNAANIDIQTTWKHGDINLRFLRIVLISSHCNSALVVKG